MNNKRLNFLVKTKYRSLTEERKKNYKLKNCLDFFQKNKKRYKNKFYLTNSFRKPEIPTFRKKQIKSFLRIKKKRDIFIFKENKKKNDNLIYKNLMKNNFQKTFTNKNKKKKSKIQKN